MSRVEHLGWENPVDAYLLAATDITTIMYTSGNIGMPKVGIGSLARFYMKDVVVRRWRIKNNFFENFLCIPTLDNNFKICPTILNFLNL